MNLIKLGAITIIGTLGWLLYKKRKRNFFVSYHSKNDARYRMIIADFTNSSTNVYFEAGFAMGMRIPVIWTCKEGHEFSFDTGQFPHITWQDADDLKKQLVNRIQAII